MNIKLKLLATLVAAALTSACGDTKHTLTPVETPTTQEQPDGSGSTDDDHGHT